MVKRSRARRLFAGSIWFCTLLISAGLYAQPSRISLSPVVSGLESPVYITTPKDGSNRKFIVEQAGRIRILQPPAAPALFLDITAKVLGGGERGLLGLAFHPQFSTNGRFYVNYTRRPDGATVVAEYRDGVEQRILFTVAQPFENHNGGMVDFGPDGFLYIGMGDGGAGNDPQNHAQNPNDLLGKMLRINVDAPGSAPAIYASGFRNPWRFSFDRLTGQLYVGDVGQNAREEIDIVVQGGNYGWRVFEGTRCTNLGPASCSTAGFIPPITEYVNNGPSGGRCAVVGGYVYRGARASLPFGAYIFGDACTGEIFMFKDGVQSVLLDSDLAISSFGEDEAGEIYVVGLTGSIVAITNPDAVTTPERPFLTPAATPVVLSTSGAGALSLGYARIVPNTGELLPAGLAIFSYQQQGVVVSEASVPATPAIMGGRFFAETAGSVNTGAAFVNSGDMPAVISFSFTDASGASAGTGEFTLAPRRQVAAFLNEPPFNGRNNFAGTFSFSSNTPVAVIALRGFVNQRGEFLMTTLPVAETGAAGATTIAHFADGGGWTTQLALVNPGDTRITGTARFLSRSGTVVQTSTYDIAPRSVERISTPGSGAEIQTGSVRLSAPAAAVSILSLNVSGVTVTQAGVPAVQASSAFRAYIESRGLLRAGLAIANPSAGVADVTLEIPGFGAATVQIGAEGQTSFFVDEIPEFANLPPSFAGVIRISSATPIAVTGLRGRTNERSEFLVTTTPPVDISLNTAPELFFPHFVEGGGYSMQFILFGRASSGIVSFFDQMGEASPLTFR
jgi:hypothetical protein